LPALRSRRLRIAASIGALALTLSTLSATALLTTQTANAAPGTPGTPQANSTLYTEGFENGTGTTPLLLTNYVGASGQQYTADPSWLTGCNGQVISFNSVGSGNCAVSTNADHNRQLAYALGQYTGVTPTTNHVVSAYTENNPGAGVEFQTVGNIPLASATGRFLTFSVDTAAQNCQVSAPQYQFSFLNASGDATPVGGVINACTSTQTITSPAVGGLAAQAANVGTYTSNGSVLLSGASVGIRMVNTNPSGGGNDAAFDNIRVLDVTPQLDKSFSPAVVPTGGTSTLTFTITNTSELAAKNGWSFTDALPAGLTVAGGTAAATTCSAGVVTAAAGATSVGVTGNLNAGQASCTVTVPVTSSTTGTYTNGPGNVTPNGLNEPGTTTVTFESPALSLVKRAGTPTDVNGNGITDAGDTIQYTFDVTNSGDVPLTDVAVTDDLVGDVTCPSTTLAAGATQTCAADDVYTVTAADATAGSVDNTATVAGTSPTGGDVTSDPSTTSTPTEAADPGITLVKSAVPSGDGNYTPGQVITYNFVVTNTGNVPLNDVTVNEGDFSGTGDLSAVTCPSDTLAVGAQETCTATYTLTNADVDAGSITNSATAEGTPTGSDTPVPSTPSEVTIPTPSAPAITVVKTASSAAITAAGQDVTYSFRVTNTGNVTLSDVAVDEGAFSGTGEISAVDCPATTLAAGAFTTCTATYTATQADIDNGGNLTNTATAGGTPPTGDPIDSTPSTSTVPVTQSPALTVVKTADAEAAEVGQVVTYSFKVTNTGNVTITDPTIADTEFSGTGELSAITCPADDTLAPGDVVTCLATYTVTQADVNAGQITNTATVTGTTPGGDPTDPSTPSTSTVTTDPLPALSLMKTADVTKITKVGQVVTYSFLVSNTGNVTITDPAVDEGKFSGHGTLSAVTCPSGDATLEPGDSVICTATYKVVAADLTDGKLTNTATATGTTPGGDPLTSDPSTSTVTPDPTTPVAGGGTTPTGGDGELAFTGTDLVAPGAALALLLMALGGTVLVLRRRKQLNGQDDNA
jgi:uncharacterized repeat protein (TIGR01451 family)